MKYLKFVLATAVSICCGPIAHSAELPKLIQIGVVNDMTSTQAAAAGMGVVIAARLAIEDFGGKVRGVPIEVLAGDHQTKPDLAVTIVRRWVDQGVSLVLDGGSSAATLASMAVTREKDIPYMYTSAATLALTNEQCNDLGIHFGHDAYALGKSLVQALMPEADSWYFITANYAGGTSIEDSIAGFVKAAGGKVLGASRHPIGAQDFSSFLLQAQQSKAKVIASVNFVQDLVNTMKQATEFGIGKDGSQRFAVPLLFLTDVKGVGLQAMPPLVTGNPFYWDMTDGTRTFAKRFAEKMNGQYPEMNHATAYTATLHYLKALEATNDISGKVVVAKMKATPVNDFWNKDVKIREDGRTLHQFYLLQLKTTAESKGPYDYFKVAKSIPPEEAYRPLSESTCPLVKK